MATHEVTTVWDREGKPFELKTYSRDHVWHFGQVEVSASAAPGYLGNPDCVDPEQAFTASLSSCHMLFFLALACQKSLVIDHYEDHAVGVLGKGEDGKMMVTTVTLHPRVTFSGEQPAQDVIQSLHNQAHDQCFIGHSVKTKVLVEIA